MRVFVPISVGGWARLFSRWDILAVLLILDLLVLPWFSFGATISGGSTGPGS